jgi:hypothetical protein
MDSARPACQIPPLQKSSRQTIFTEVEELIDNIGLGSHIAGEQKLHE